jgi:hypothetical protein
VNFTRENFVDKEYSGTKEMDKKYASMLTVGNIFENEKRVNATGKKFRPRRMEKLKQNDHNKVKIFN